MVLPRPLLIAIAGLALLLMTFTVTRGRGSDGSGGSPSAAAKPAESPVDAKPLRRNPPVRERSGPAKKPAARDGTARRPSPPRATPAPPRRPRTDAGVPPSVSRALSEHKAIVLLFTLNGSADDAATREALQSLRSRERGNRRLAVFSDGIGNVGRYARLVGGLGISQVPSVVVVDPQRRAQLIEGYVDAGTLRQYLADALR